MAEAQPDPVARPSVFISYAREPDRVLARELAVSLRALGYAVALDLDGLQPGEIWAPRILELVRSSAVFLFLVSRAAVASKACTEEWQLAVGERKRLLPVRTEALSDDEIPPEFRDCQRVDHLGAERSFADLVCTIDRELRRDAAWHREQNYLAALERDWRSQPEASRSLFLLSPSQAARARQSLNERGDRLPEPTLAVLAFLAASEADHAMRQAEQRRRVRMQRVGIGVGIGLALSTVGLGWLLIDAAETRRDADAGRQAVEIAAASLPAASAADPGPRPAVAAPAPAASAPSKDALQALTAQFSQSTRRAASDALRQLYLAAPADSAARQAIVDATIAALQPRDVPSSYRVNLYVFVTLGRLPGWKAGPAQRDEVERAVRMFAEDATYRWWTDKAAQVQAR